MPPRSAMRDREWQKNWDAGFGLERDPRDVMLRPDAKTSNDLAQTELQTVFGERLFEKPQRLACQRPLACLRVRVRRHEYTADSEALADLVRSLDAIARSIESNIHEHHIWTFCSAK